ncbi:hypothetical protein BKA70DRAFT_1416213 [Coprinopsis sp. MPI-PUGE-AT-0042]|nr:hypothetical protein BKA70DRAFT_1416213 [Coprinopsis sp. MPI-PUGE-AT-0042]
MPHLEELDVRVAVRAAVQSEWVYTCPIQTALLAKEYASAAYKSIRIFRLVVIWTVQGPEPPPRLEGHPTARYLERSPSGFAILDDRLSDEGLFSSLTKVELHIEPTYCGTPPMTQERVKDLRLRLQREAKEVFYKTSNRVDDFSVMTDGAFVQ